MPGRPRTRGNPTGRATSSSTPASPRISPPHPLCPLAWQAVPHRKDTPQLDPKPGGCTHCTSSGPMSSSWLPTVASPHKRKEVSLRKPFSTPHERDATPCNRTPHALGVTPCVARNLMEEPTLLEEIPLRYCGPPGLSAGEAQAKL